MQYEMVYGETMEAIAKKVNEYLAKGWRPQGGPLIYKGIFYQALVKAEEA